MQFQLFQCFFSINSKYEFYLCSRIFCRNFCLIRTSRSVSSSTTNILDMAAAGLHVDHELELRRSLDRNVARLGALEDLVDEDRSATIECEKVHAVAEEPTRVRILDEADRGQAVLDRELRDRLKLAIRTTSSTIARASTPSFAIAAKAPSRSAATRASTFSSATFSLPARDIRGREVLSPSRRCPDSPAPPPGARSGLLP